MDQIAVIDDPRAAEISLHPVRSQLLAELADSGTASSLGLKLGLSRQSVNYHLRALESHGLIELVEERRIRNTTESVFRATATTYLISPNALASVAPDPDRAPDQLSAMWLLSLAGRLVQEIGTLITRSHKSGKLLASFAMDTEINFANAQDRAKFVAKFSEAVESLVGEFHAPHSSGSRKHRLIVALHPSITT